jgi:hypothetical protein
MVFQRTGGAVAGKLAYEDTNTAMSFGTTTGHELKFLTSNTERMQIDSSGNVGIGVSNPTKPLHVESSVTNTNTVLVKNTAGTGVNYGLEIAAGTNATDHALHVTSSSGTSLLRVDGSGNVGIGTSSPTLVGFGTGTNGLEIADATLAGIRLNGNAADSMYLISGATKHWVYGRGAVPMTFSTNGTEAMRIDSNGQLLLGTTVNVFGGADRYGYNFYANGQSNQSIDGTGGAVAQYINLENADGQYMSFYKDRAAVGSIGANSGVAYIVLNDATSDNVAALKGAGGAILPSTNAGADKDGTMSLGSSGARFASLYLSGIANIGGTANFASWSNSGASNGIEIRSADAQILNSHTGTATHVYQYFYNANGIVGSISASGSSTAYNTSSDYRLKENVVAMSGATERLKQLKPSRFNFIADADTTVDGFLAHEVQDIVPEAITGAKDAVDEDGNPEYQGIDQSKLVPLLVATIQELEARIAALES